LVNRFLKANLPDFHNQVDCACATFAARETVEFFIREGERRVVFLGLMERAFPVVFLFSRPPFKACEAHLGKHRAERDAPDILIFVHYSS